MNRFVAFFLSVLLLGSCGDRSFPMPPQPQDGEKPQNVIMLIGDGMGLGQISAAVYDAGDGNMFQYFPVIGLQKTYSASDLITDSGAGATAMACGVKTYNNAIGVDADTLPVRNLIEIAEEKGMATGIISTAAVVHATPASFVAHHRMRVEYEAIAQDFLDTELDLFIGGGMKYFTRREDERNLVAELKKKGYVISDYFREELHSSLLPKSKNFGYFTADNQPVTALQGRAYLPRATRLGLSFLEKRDAPGFFIMIEGAQIDWAGHANRGNQLLLEMEDFSNAIREALRFYQEHPETLIIVTADHESGGIAINPGSTTKDLNLAFTTNGHTATMVPVFAIGPGADQFRGVYENTEIFHRLRRLINGE